MELATAMNWNTARPAKTPRPVGRKSHAQPSASTVIRASRPNTEREKAIRDGWVVAKLTIHDVDAVLHSQRRHRLPVAETTRIDAVASPEGDSLLVSNVPVLVVWRGGGGTDVANILGASPTHRLELHAGEDDDFIAGGAAADLVNEGPAATGSLSGRATR